MSWTGGQTHFILKAAAGTSDPKHLKVTSEAARSKTEWISSAAANLMNCMSGCALASEGEKGKGKGKHCFPSSKRDTMIGSCSREECGISGEYQMPCVSES